LLPRFSPSMAALIKIKGQQVAERRPHHGIIVGRTPVRGPQHESGSAIFGIVNATRENGFRLRPGVVERQINFAMQERSMARGRPMLCAEDAKALT
jgi:hypothetical protein